MKKNILHITPHLGGGVGKVLSSLLVFEKKSNTEICHKLLVLEKPKNPQFVDICLKNNIQILFTQNLDEIEQEIKNSDAIVLNWWHHPLNSWLFANFPKIPCRVILWSHINGCNYPKLKFDLVKDVNKV